MSEESSSPALPNISDRQPTTSTSSLGGNQAIQERFKAFQEAEAKGIKPGQQNTEQQQQSQQQTQQQEKQQQEDKSKQTQEQEGGEDTPLKSKLPQQKKVKTHESTTEKKDEVQLTEAEKEKASKEKDEKRGTDGMTDAQRKSFLEFKAKAERLDELEAKVRDHESTAKERDELKELRKNLEEKVKTLDAKAKAFDITSSEEFQRLITKPVETATKAMQRICKDHKIDYDQVVGALESGNIAEADTILSELGSSLPSLTLKTYERIISDLRDLDNKASKMIADAPATWTAMEEERKKMDAEKADKSRKTYHMAADAVFNGDSETEGLKQRFSTLMDMDADDGGKVGDKVLEEAKKIDFSKMTPDVLAYYAMAGQSLLYVNSVMDSLRKENENLKKALGKEKVPGPADTHSSSSQENGSKKVTTNDRNIPDEEFEKMTPGQRFQAQFFGKK